MHKLVAGGIMLLVCTLGWSARSFGQEVHTPRGELRIVDKHPLNWQWIVLNIFEHLVEFDKDGQLVPRLATEWRWLDERSLELTLRQGVKFHNGEVFDAEIVKLNVEESAQLRHSFHLGNYLQFKPGLRIEIRDPYILRFHFPEPDGAALFRLSFIHIANRQFYREFGWGEKHW